MGRRKNNPELVEELIDGIRTMSQQKWEEKYNSLSSSDQDIIQEALNQNWKNFGYELDRRFNNY